ncbi:hypothetical protein CRUP_016697 [Coryphaenoides rupestris]|nr:hypothetical protein CRUP_016697 [Coryphaenoides rupestris]
MARLSCLSALCGYGSCSKYTAGLDSDESDEGVTRNGGVPQQNGSGTHRMNNVDGLVARTALPAPMFSRTSVSIWSILKKCIGLELSKITMPIAFNEPLSFLQRMSEYMEHTYLLNKACSLPDSVQRMQAVAAFAVSAVASQWDRTGKPFNPLLGETYELTREDQGYRLLSEQVSHHPPVSAFHAESLYNEAYTWSNPFCCVHNIILGSLWIEQYGTVEILNHSTGDKCVLNFKPCGMFGKELHRVEGYIQDKSHRKTEKKGDGSRKHRQEESDRRLNDDSDDMPEVQDSVAVVPGSTLLWRVASRPPNSTRAMENGLMDEASREKERLEQKQREARKERAKSLDVWATRWFQQGTNPFTGTQDWLYTGEYFNRNYTTLPNIY